MRIPTLTSMFRVLICIASLGLVCSCGSSQKNDTQGTTEHYPILSQDIRIRDPFILADSASQTYYLYASILNRTEQEGQGVEVYTSKDLMHWSEPALVFQVPSDFWAGKWVWAPEVHAYKGKYYLFVTFTSEDLLDNPPQQVPHENWPPYYKRGTQILYADRPEGPFQPFRNSPHLPLDWMTLDGTLWEEEGQPYMVYCHEWVQIEDGTMDLIALENDLSAVKGQNQVLFHASDAPWASKLQGFDTPAYVTDGCFVFKTHMGKLLMIWSSFSDAGGYSIGTVESTSGSIKGPWRHQEERLFEADGGHGMIFNTFDGLWVIALHQPNKSPKERMQLYKIKDLGDQLVLDGKLFE